MDVSARRSPSDLPSRLYLDPNLVAPGDVLLQLGEGHVSAAIALATNSRFSHAAVVVAPMLIFEALDDGVLPTTLPLAAVQPTEGPVRFATEMIGVRDAALLRHRQIEKDLAAHRFDVRDVFMEELLKYLGRPYAETWDLLQAAPSGSPLQILGAWGKSNSIGKRLPERERGIFCSELVALAYAGARLPLFAEAIPAGCVSPAAIEGSSFLDEVPGAVFPGTPATPTVEMKHFIKLAEETQTKREDHAAVYAIIAQSKMMQEKQKAQHSSGQMPNTKKK